MNIVTYADALNQNEDNPSLNQISTARQPHPSVNTRTLTYPITYMLLVLTQFMFMFAFFLLLSTLVCLTVWFVLQLPAHSLLLLIVECSPPYTATDSILLVYLTVATHCGMSTTVKGKRGGSERQTYILHILTP